MCGQRQLKRYVRRIVVANSVLIYSQVHQDQLSHVRRGCLARQREDICADGSRIEGSHKGWNSLQRSHSSGVLVLTALSHDFVLRRNIRLGTRESACDTFATSTFGSHHIRLVDAVASQWNTLVTKHQKTQPGVLLKALPQLSEIASGETFGAVSSEHTATFGGLLEIKPEPEDEVVSLTNGDTVNESDVINSLKIDPLLLLTPHSIRDASVHNHKGQPSSSSFPSLSVHNNPYPKIAVPALVDEIQPNLLLKRSPADDGDQQFPAPKKGRTVSRKLRCS